MPVMDERPPVWIGHAVLTVSDLGRSTQWWTGIGMREVERNEHVVVLELRGGTHLVLVPGPPDTGDAPFDVMVDDLAATPETWSALGVDARDISEGRFHTA